LAFDQTTRNRLQKFVSDTRNILTDEFTRQLQAIYGLDPKSGTISELGVLTDMDNEQIQNALVLREMVAHYSAGLHGKSEKQIAKESLERIIREQAFTVLNRLGALRMAEARGFLLESIAKGYNSKGFQLYKNLSGTALGETGEAYRCYLFSIFDEFSLDLAVLFDRHSIQGRLFPRESALLALLEQINHFEIKRLWEEDETIGWIYQYFNSQEERKKMRAESSAPRNSRELAVRNQFFTPRYVVEFLTDNTLGRIWYEMTQGKTALVDACQYLVRRPSEIFLSKGEAAPDNKAEENESISQEELLKQPVYVPYRALKDPRELRMLDPACGSMHFGLYAFDLYEKIYEEAWQLESEHGSDAFERSDELKPLQLSFESFEDCQKAIPKLIIEQNIHGVDIDPRAVQIAGLSLWQRAQRSWHQMGIKPDQRPVITKSNVVCAEPMPGEKEMLKEFAEGLNPPVLGQLVENIFDKMELAGEAGTLLKIEEELYTSIRDARLQWIRQSSMLFTPEQMMSNAKQKDMGYDLSGINDESFWDTAEERIINALRDYADKTQSKNSQKKLFAEDAVKGFAFIDLCRKRFDVVLMNPPFGLPVESAYKYFRKQYPNNYVDIYSTFVSRGMNLLFDGMLGAITSRAFLTTKKLERWRAIDLSRQMSILLDLGLGVMDDAFVESCAYILSSRDVHHLVAFDKRGVEDKNPEVSSLTSKSHKTYYVDHKNFHLLPGVKFLYSLPIKVFHLINSGESLEPRIATARQGLCTFDDFRFLRLHSEITIKKGERILWQNLAKGGEYAVYFSELPLLVNRRKNADELASVNIQVNGQTAQSRQASDYYFLPGGTYSKRSAKGFSVRALPKDCVIATKGPAVISQSSVHPAYIVGWLNSRLITFLVQLQANASEFNTGIIKQLPWVSGGLEATLTVKTHQVIDDLLWLSSFNENSAYFSQISEGECLDEMYQTYLELSKNTIKRSNELLNQWNEYIDQIYNIDSTELEEEILGDIYSAKKIRERDVLGTLRQKEGFAENLTSILFGIVLGRWNPDYINKYPHKNTYNSFERIPEFPPASNGTNALGIPIIECSLDKNVLKEQFEKVAKKLSLNGKGTLIDELLILFNSISLESYFSNQSGFFDAHLKATTSSRRQAPIYWPLQTPSGSYTLWVYYHRLTEQTPYSCVNDFVEPKLKTVSDDINRLRNKSARTSSEEKELSKLSDMEAELKDFRDELLRIAKFWKPNLNDGVQITAAPLWKLFQHKPWQKKLKETWEKIEKGEYDWAHLAYSTWPERVLHKCHIDRSLAIAHDFENDFWEEVDFPVISRGKKTGKTNTDWQPKNLSESELEKLIQQKMAEMK